METDRSSTNVHGATTIHNGSPGQQQPQITDPQQQEHEEKQEQVRIHSRPESQQPLLPHTMQPLWVTIVSLLKR